MFVSWWLIVPVIAGVAILFMMVSRLTNEVDKLETALEESRGQLKSASQHAEACKLANLRMTENLLQVKGYTQQLAGSSGPEQERLLYEMHCALNLATNNVIHHPDFIEHPSASGATRPQQPGETLPLMFR